MEIKIKDINPTMREIQIKQCLFSNNKKMVLTFFLDVSHDNTWYEIKITNIESGHVINTCSFNGIRKAVDYWNQIIKESKYGEGY